MAEIWVHGHSLQIETGAVSQVWRAGFYTKVEGNPGSTNWFHYAIPTTAGKSVDRVMLVFTLGSDATLLNVAAWDGGTNIMPNKSAPDAQATITDSTGDHNLWTWNVTSAPVQFGVGISLQVKVGNAQMIQQDNYGRFWTPRTIAIIAAGCNFTD